MPEQIAGSIVVRAHRAFDIGFVGFLPVADYYETSKHGRRDRILIDVISVHRIKVRFHIRRLQLMTFTLEMGN